MDSLLRDVRIGLRSLWRTPTYTIAVVVTLGLGIGANTAIFSIINGVLVQPLPYADGDRLVFLRQTRAASGGAELGFSVRDIEDLRARSRSLDDIAEYHAMTFTLLGRGEAELVQTGVVSAHFFDLLGMDPIAGRGFVDADDRPGAEPVLMLSHGYWQRRFGGDPEVVGEALEMNGMMHTVIGVLPPVPQFPDENDVYMTTSSCPMRSSPDMIAGRSMRMMSVFGRAAAGQTSGDVGTEMGRLLAQLGEEHPADYDLAGGQAIVATPLKDELVQNARPIFLLLLGCSGLVLLIACANVANLALARVSRRRNELSLRRALGAGRARLAGQLLTEHLLIALVGGGLGLALASMGHDVLVAFAARFTTRAYEADLNVSVMLFALTLSVAAGVVFGVAPALSATGPDAEGMRSSRGIAGPTTRRVQSGLVVTQVGVASVLLIGCGLTLKSFWLLQAVDTGFDARGVLSMDVTLTSANSTLTREQQRDFYWALVDRIAGVNGVEAVGLTSGRPMDPNSSMPVRIRAEGNAEPEIGLLPGATSQIASEGYFDAMRIPVVAGRGFSPADADLTTLVAVVTESLAEQVFPDRDPIGQRVAQCYTWSESCSPPFEIIGIVADHRAWSLEDEPGPQIFRASRQSALPGGTVVVRTRTDPAPFAETFVDVVHELNPDVPVSQVATLEARVDEGLAPRRLTMTLLLIFGLVALAVSVAGVAGLIAFNVSQRRREIGVRIALGSSRNAIVAHILRRGTSLIGLGLALGMVGAWVGRRFAGALLWGTPALDPATWLATVVLLAAVSTLACYVPARQATRLDPLEALRSE